MIPISSEGLNRETDEVVYFYTPSFDALNNFSAHRIEIWNKRFPTAEHTFQWKKFSEVSSAIAKLILQAGCPEEAQNIAHEHKSAQPKDWQEKKVAVMEEILQAKFIQHETVRDALKKSGSRIIYENSPIDSFWGVGPDGNGTNMVGVLWMKIRTDNF